MGNWLSFRAAPQSVMGGMTDQDILGYMDARKGKSSRRRSGGGSRRSNAERVAARVDDDDDYDDDAAASDRNADVSLRTSTPEEEFAANHIEASLEQKISKKVSLRHLDMLAKKRRCPLPAH